MRSQIRNGQGFFLLYNLHLHIPVSEATRSEACICRRLLDGIAGSKPVGGMDISLL
jgi:hypothetical protein